MINVSASKYSTETLAIGGGCLASWHEINDGLKWKPYPELGSPWLALVDPCLSLYPDDIWFSGQCCCPY